MKANIRLGMPVVAVVMLGAAGIVNAQVLAEPVQLEPQPAATVQPAHRAQVVEALGKGDVTAAEKIISDLQAQLQATSALAAQSGSIFFEELKACGFYPQETRLACVIEIKQQIGYAGLVGAAGSMEHVYFCIDWDNNGIFTQLESAGQGSVQMHDDPPPVSPRPPWSMSSIGTSIRLEARARRTAARRPQRYRLRPLLGSRPPSRWPPRRPDATMFRFGATA